MTHVEKANNINKSQTDASSDEVHNNVLEEPSEEVNVMGPGQILSEARNKAGLTQQDVADKLNFRLSLVDEIESERFDTSLPETFNRGYLRNYAKLVNVSQDDVIVSYQQLNIAKAQASKLQSFSKGTEKLAESNRIMWISYFILAILIGSSVVWWMQNNKEQDQPQTFQEDVEIKITKSATKKNEQPDSLAEPQVSESLVAKVDIDNDNIVEAPAAPSIVLNQEITDTSTLEADTESRNVAEQTEANTASVSEADETEVTLTNVTFTFSGDCWVNISDATGERIAWGVKKLGYVMKISGQAPFDVTLGKPELVAINFADEVIDMSQFNMGNIAKFTLPVTN
ncbi:MAG: cytoskeleton protein RodZ [Colwellia sp.]|jgi:cytoskeleton protein RodZ